MSFGGSSAQYEQVSNLTPSQLRIQNERERASRGAFNEVGNYYRSNLGNTPQDFQAFAAPELRQFHEQTIPGLAEQFAGMGAGALSSSGFRNAAVSAGTDLSERLGALRANLRQNAAQGLQGLATGALTPHTFYQQTQPGGESFFGGLAQQLPAVAAGFLTGGPAGGGLAALGSLGSSLFGKTSPYGSGTQGLQGISGAVQSGLSKPFNPIGR